MTVLRTTKSERTMKKNGGWISILHFFVVVSLVVVFNILTLWNPVEAKKVFDVIKSWTIENFDLF